MGSCEGQVEERGIFFLLKLSLCIFFLTRCINFKALSLSWTVWSNSRTLFIRWFLIIGLYLFLKQIVTLGMPSVSPIEKVGTYVNPRDWNALISDPDTVSDQNFIAVVYPVIGKRITNNVTVIFNFFTTLTNTCSTYYSFCENGLSQSFIFLLIS